MGALLEEPPPVIERGEGSYVYTASGHRLLDASSGVWNNILGHGRQDVIDAMAGQLRALASTSTIGRRSRVADELAHELLRLAPPRMRRVMLHCTGTAAVEGAVLMVRQYFKLVGQPRRAGIISVEGSYHGCSLLGAAVSGDAADARWLAPLPAGCHHIPRPHGEAAAAASLAALERLVRKERPGRLAAFIFEPVMGTAGVIVPPRSWITGAIAICRQHGIKVIADEVVTALGRVGEWFASAGQAPDLIALGKGLGAGYAPVAATLACEELFEPFARRGGVAFKYGSTMDGYAAGCAAARAVLLAIEREGLVARAASLGEGLLSRLRELERYEVVGRVRGRGLMMGVPLVEPGDPDRPLRAEWTARIVGRLFEAGVVLMRANATLTLLPPLTISEAELDQLVQLLEGVLSHPGEPPAGRARGRLRGLLGRDG